MERTCKCGCGRSLRLLKQSAVYYNQACKKRAWERSNRNGIPSVRPFVGLDGEGTHVKNDPRYILLACGNGEWIGDKKGLSTEDCLDFLIHLPKGSRHGGGVKPIYVWFAFDYDVNMILKDVPFDGPNSIRQLRETNQIIWRGFRITYIRRKILRIRRGNLSHFSVDVWGFFQSNFESALRTWGVESNEIIEVGKANRSNFHKWSMKRIREYNDQELILLAQLCEQLRDSVIPLELTVRSWHGPAALAASWLTKNKIRRFIGSETPTPVIDAASRAYFGGRIDVVGYGIVDPVYHYDIVSAYPSATRYLPDLANLTWKRTTKLPPPGTIYLAKVFWRITEFNYWYPLPWRDPDGSIVYPREGTGWYWNTELEAVLRKYGKDQFQIQECWVAEGTYRYPLRKLIEEMFRYRAQLKAEGHPSNKAIKLILNSLYGKFAQTVGSNNYFSSLWAGMITAHTRAQLTPAITERTVCVMTDSIWSMDPLKVRQGSKLGDWESQPENKLWLAEAGLYAAETPDGKRDVWQRGFDKRHPVDVPELVSTWLYTNDIYQPTYTVSRFVGMGLASITHYPWCTWQEIERRIAPVAYAGTGKRYPFLPLTEQADIDAEERQDPFRFLVPRFGKHQEPGMESAPYSRLTLDEDNLKRTLEDETNEGYPSGDRG